MKRGRINKKLSQLESIYSIKSQPLLINPTHVSDYIHNFFENIESYGISNPLLTKEWFSDFSERNPKKASDFISSFLENDGHKIQENIILEGINEYNKGFEDA